MIHTECCRPARFRIEVRVAFHPWIVPIEIIRCRRLEHPAPRSVELCRFIGSIVQRRLRSPMRTEHAVMVNAHARHERQLAKFHRVLHIERLVRNLLILIVTAPFIRRIAAMPLRTSDQRVILVELPTILIVKTPQKRVELRPIRHRLVIIEYAQESRRRRAFLKSIGSADVVKHFRHLVAGKRRHNRVASAIILRGIDGTMPVIDMRRAAIVDLAIEAQGETAIAIIAAIHLISCALVVVIEVASVRHGARHEPAVVAVRALVCQLKAVRLPRTRAEVNSRFILHALLRDDVDDAAHSITAVESRAAALDDLDALDILHRRNHMKVCTGTTRRCALIIIDPLPINKDDHAFISIETDDFLLLPAHVRDGHAVHMLNSLADRRIVIRSDFPRRDDCDVGWRVHALRRYALRRHDGRAEIVHCIIRRFISRIAFCREHWCTAETRRKKSRQHLPCQTILAVDFLALHALFSSLMI